jgi:DNA repair protein RadD
VTFKWRDYQADALDSFDRVLSEDPANNPLVVIPTGGGKGPLSAELARRHIERTGERVIVATHVKELVRQNFDQSRRVAPSITCGIYSASLNRKDLFGDVTVANVQSIARAAKSFQNTSLLLIDEAHLLQHGEDGQYHQLIKGLREHTPHLQVGGLTATPWRTNSGNLCEPYKGQSPLFSEVAYEIGLSELVADGYLTPLVSRSTGARQDTGGVHRRGGEFVASELNEAVNVDEINRDIVQETIATAFANNRKAWLVFAVSVDHARRLSDLFRQAGIKADYVHGGTEPRERDRIISRYQHGHIQCLVNCNVLTTGFDYAGIDLIVFARPTCSPGLYLQMLGRGTRVKYGLGHDLSTVEGRLAAIQSGGKPDCIVLDFAGNTLRHGLADRVEGVFRRHEKAEDDLRECPKCNTYNDRSNRECLSCGEVLISGGGGGSKAEDREKQLQRRNLADRILMGDDDVWWSDVLRATFRRTDTPGKPPTLLLSYQIAQPDGQTAWASEPLCFDHDPDTWAAKKARAEWRKRTSGRPPVSVAEAINRIGELEQPNRVKVRRNGRWLNVTAVEIPRRDRAAA